MATVHDQPVDEIIGTQLASASDSVLVVHSSIPVFRAGIEAIRDQDDPPPVQLLADEATVKQALDDFLIACRTADTIADETLELRTAETTPGNQLLLTDTQMTALVSAGDTVVGLSTDDAATVEPITEYYTSLWNDAEPYSLRTPALSRIQETLRDEFGDAVADDFQTVLDSVDSIPRSGHSLDEVGIALLVAAKNGELFYDISRWGEDVGLAAKATFSRTKTQLEDHGLLDTEKVPIEVGRPRLRLLLANQELRTAPPEDLLPLARTQIQQPTAA